MTVFLTWPIAASGTSSARTLPDRLAEIVNVRDFGANGLGGDQTTQLQAAIDAAFGPASGPHGTNATLNRTLLIPSGDYLVTSPLVLTDVVGAQILGGGMWSTYIHGSGGNSILTINGCRDTLISGLGLNCGSKSSSSGLHGIKMDAGSVGLSNVTVSNCFPGGGQYGIRIAPGGVGGRNIFLLDCVLNEIGNGVTIEGPDCVVTTLGGAISECNKGVWVKDGNFTCNAQFAGTTQLDIQHDSTGVTTAYGFRSESRDLVNVTNGTVILIGALHQSAAVGYAVTCTSPGVVRLTGCELADIGSPTASYITGTGDVYLRNVVWTNGSPIFLSSFTGKICECVTSQIFTFAQLPPAAEGLMLNMSNANTNTWGANVTTTGANRVSVRYNGTNWTVVGK